jgi:hypothetical protein
MKVDTCPVQTLKLGAIPIALGLQGIIGLYSEKKKQLRQFTK